MGVIYSVACRTCKVTRDLDKFYTSDIHEVETKKQAIGYKSKIEKDSFRAGLLVSFMGKHLDHDCVLFQEHSSCALELSPFENEHGYVEDTDYWADPQPRSILSK